MVEKQLWPRICVPPGPKQERASGGAMQSSGGPETTPPGLWELSTGAEVLKALTGLAEAQRPIPGARDRVYF